MAARPSTPLQALVSHLFIGEAVRTGKALSLGETGLSQAVPATVCLYVHSHTPLPGGLEAHPEASESPPSDTEHLALLFHPG